MSRAAVAVALVLSVVALPLEAQRGRARNYDRYDDTFRKYSKRFFGPGFDWRIFKAQGMAESNLDPGARSQVGARGVMQLMPSTFGEVRSRNPEFKAIDDVEWNIAAGINYDRRLWQLWRDSVSTADHIRFMFGSYNAGRVPLLRAQGLARRRALDHRIWPSVEQVAPQVPRWRDSETLEYVRRIEANVGRMDGDGRVK